MNLSKNDFELLNFDQNSYINLSQGSNKDVYPLHWHTACEIIMPLEGQCHVIIGNHPYVLNKHDILFINIGELHEMPKKSAGSRLIIQFDFSLISSLPDFSANLFHFKNLRLIDGDTQEALHEKIKEYMLSLQHIYHTNDNYKSALMYAALLRIYVEIANHSYAIQNQFPDITSLKQQEYLQKFKKAVHFIHNNYQHPITLDIVANEANFSKYHFSRLFKQFSGKSFTEYVNDYRLSIAEVALLNPNQTVTEVALDSGFSSLSTFNRAFKSKKDCTPSDFRRMYFTH